MVAVLHSISLFIALFTQTLQSPIAGAWLFFHICGCAMLVYNNKYPKKRPFLWYAILTWGLALGLSAFILQPVLKAAATMWVLLAMPTLALCLRKENIKSYLWGFGSVLFIYACGLVLQMATHTQLDPGMTDRYGWPLLDPNNGAAVLNCAFLPLVWLSTKNWKYWPVTLVFGLALFATGSKAGMSAAVIGMMIMLAVRYGGWVIIAALFALKAMSVAAFFFYPQAIVVAAHSLQSRLPIWWMSWLVLKENILTGTGIGTFGMFRVQRGFELYIPPTYAHNDILQFAVEMGIPIALLFCALVASVLFSTRKSNLISGVTMLAVFIGAMVEFQFYIPSISLLMGLALAVHMRGKV